MKNNTWAVWGPPEAWGPWARAQRTHLIRRPWEGGVKAKFRGSQKALAIKKRVVSLHAEPLEEELGVAIITRAL